MVRVLDRIATHKISRGLSPRDSLCLAPERAIYFRAAGGVTACCYNFEDEYGTYPHSSVDSIWQSTIRKQMEVQLSRDEFPAGCYKCEKNISSGNDGGTLAARFDFLKDPEHYVKDHAYPTLMEFEIGTICNLECVMCNGWVSSAIRANREKLPPLKNPYDKEFITQVEPYLHKLHVANFLGGEPFLNPLNNDIWEILAQHNPQCHVNITTNGTILNQEIKDLLLRLRPNIVISIESFDKTNYESIRKNANLSHVMENIDWLLQHKLLGSLTVCPMEKNIPDIPEMLSFCNKNNIRIYYNTIFEPKELSLRAANLNRLSAHAEIMARLLLEEEKRWSVRTYNIENNLFNTKSLLRSIESILGQTDPL